MPLPNSQGALPNRRGSYNREIDSPRMKRVPVVNPFGHPPPVTAVEQSSFDNYSRGCGVVWCCLVLWRTCRTVQQHDQPSFPITTLAVYPIPLRYTANAALFFLDRRVRMYDSWPSKRLNRRITRLIENVQNRHTEGRLFVFDSTCAPSPGTGNLSCLKGKS